MLAADRIEIEVKYAVPDASTFEKLLSLELLRDYRLVPSGVEEVVDRYVDTPERHLARAGYACRLRASAAGAPEVVAVKALGGACGAVHLRVEREVRVSPGTPPQQWPAGPVREIVLQLAGERPLVELLRVTQHRSTRDVESRGQKVAAVSLDRVHFGDSSGGPDHEIEIELTPFADACDLRALAELLQPFGLRPQPLSKFERALALLGSAEGARPDALEPSPAAGSSARDAGPTAVESGRRRGSRRAGVLPADPMSEAGRKILRLHFEAMLAMEAGTLAGDDPEDLHDMRVATRRQRAALRIAAPHFRRKAIRPVRDGLRALAGVLGAVRDLDVLIAGANARRAALSAEEHRGLGVLVDSWRRRRDAARARLLAHLGGTGYAEFKERYARFLDRRDAGAPASPEERAPRPRLAAHVLPTEIWAHYSAVCAFGTALPWASVEMLHSLRIEGKRLRYLLESFREVLDPCVEEAIAAAVALQDHLGEIQDAVVAVGLAREFLAGPEAAGSPQAATAAGRYLESCRARIEELRRSVGAPWAAVSGAPFKSWLARAAAAL
jgi:CHAD domain-containing protein